MEHGLKRNGRVLHVADDGGGACGAMARSLSGAGAAVVRCADVYRALALLGGDEASFDAVLVCVDGLSVAGHEFFAQATGGGVPVWVYTELGRRDAVRRAMERGAGLVVEVTPSDVGSALGRCSEMAVACDGPEHEPPIAASAEDGVAEAEQGALCEDSRVDESSGSDAAGMDPALPPPSRDVYSDEGPLLTREEIDSLILGVDEEVDSLRHRGVLAGGGED